MSKHRRAAVLTPAVRPSLHRPGAALLGSAVLAAGLLPLTASAAFAADKPTLAQCNAYRSAADAAETSAADLIAKKAAESDADAKLQKLIAADASEAEITAARSAASKAGAAEGKAYSNDVQARGTLATTLEAIGGDPMVCTDIKGEDPVKDPVKGSDGKGKSGGEGKGNENRGGGAGSGGGTQVLGARVESGGSSSTTTVPVSYAPSEGSTEYVDASQVSDVPSGAVEAGDGSTSGNHIGEALLGLGALGMAGAGTAGAVAYRRRQSV